MSRAIRVLVVDDRPAMRMGLSTMLMDHPSIEAVTEADGLFSALEQVADQIPDVVLMDACGANGDPSIAAMRLREKNPSLRLLFLLDHDHQCPPKEIPAGADGYVANSAAPRKLVDAILSVHRGEPTLDSAYLVRLLERYQVLNQELIRLKLGLTDQEVDLLKEAAEGATNEEIAARLYLSEITVIRKIQRVIAKLGVANKTQAVAELAKRGII